MDTLRIGKAKLALLAPFVALFASAVGMGCSSGGSGFGAGGTAGTGEGSMSGNTSESGSGGMASSTAGSDGTAGSVVDPSGGVVNSTGGTPNPEGGAANPTAGTGNPNGGSTTGGQTGTAGTGGAPPVTPTCPKPAPGICHEFIANDNGRQQVTYVNEFTSTKPGGIVWQTNIGHATPSPENSPRTIEIVNGGKNVLVSVNDGYVELDIKTGAKVAEATAKFGGITGACRMPNGTTAVGTNAQIRFINAGGGETGQAINLPTGSNLRAINRNPTTGDFWLSKTETVYQLSPSGQVLWQAFMGAGTKGYAVWWREGGGAYGTTGEPATIVEIDKDKKIVATIGGRDAHADLALDFFSGFVRRPNGNYIVANWLGHLGNPGANTAEIVELTPQDKPVWTWGNQTLARQVTNVYVLQ